MEFYAAERKKELIPFASAPLLKEFLCGLHAAAPSPGEPILHALLLPQNHKLSLGQGWPEPIRAPNSFR